MAREHTTSKSLISIVGAAAVALGLVILFGKLDGTAAGLIPNLLGAAARTALGLVLSLVPAAWQGLQTYAFDHHWFAPCPLQIVATFWSLLHVMAGAA
jgi:hypothetical protein